MYPHSRTPQGSLVTALPGTAATLNVGQDYLAGWTVFAQSAGTVAVIPADNDDATPVTFFVNDGGMVPVRVRQIVSTGTTASGFTGVR